MQKNSLTNQMFQIQQFPEVLPPHSSPLKREVTGKASYAVTAVRDVPRMPVHLGGKVYCASVNATAPHPAVINDFTFFFF